VAAGGRTETDVAIVGGGIAGLVTALELLDCGRSVTVIERDVDLGGLAKEAFGGMFFVRSPEQRRLRIPDSAELALDDWMRVADFDPDDEWPRRWAKAFVTRCTEEVGDWLRERGVRWFPVVNWAERGLWGDGNSVPRFHITWGTGKRLVDVVLRDLREHERAGALDVRTRHRVTELRTEADEITGVAGEREDAREPFEVQARSVVIAAGGIGGDLERVRREWPRDWSDPPQFMLNGSHQGADGAMHDLVAELGGNVTHLDRMWNYPDGVHHPRPRRPDHGIKLIPPRSGLWLDPTGRRYNGPPLVSAFDEHHILREVCRQGKPWSWNVFNWKIGARELNVSGSEHNHDLRERRGARFVFNTVRGDDSSLRQFVEECEDFLTADSLPELAKQMNELAGTDDVDAGLLEEEVRRYDAQLDRGPRFYNDDQLRKITQLRRWRGDRVRAANFGKIADPKAMPFVAVRMLILSRKSMGGIQTDLSCRVLKPGGDPIPGLYAVGEAAGFGGGGIHGHRSLEGTFLGGCVFTGRVAGKAIAEERDRSGTREAVPATTAEG
jgi:predicted oxidoreductase